MSREFAWVNIVSGVWKQKEEIHGEEWAGNGMAGGICDAAGCKRRALEGSCGILGDIGGNSDILGRRFKVCAVPCKSRACAFSSGSDSAAGIKGGTMAVLDAAWRGNLAVGSSGTCIDSGNCHWTFVHSRDCVRIYGQMCKASCGRWHSDIVTIHEVCLGEYINREMIIRRRSFYEPGKRTDWL